VTGAAAPRLVKCVVWDIDNTLLDGVYLESGAIRPAANPAMAGALADLSSRGILHAIASKNPPEAAVHAAAATGADFAAVECGWGAKSEAVARIAADLAIGTDALAFVDDDPYERAEVGTALPEVLVLAPDEVAGAAGWPEFGAAAVTDEARRRGEMYAARRRRQAAEQAFGGSRGEFLASAGTQVTIRAATPADVPRLHELSVRTRQFNSARRPVAGPEFAALIDAPGTGVTTVTLRDAFGDDGIVGACVISRDGDGTWTVPLLMMSCRAMGRGVIGALLAWVTRSAASAGAREVAVRCVLTARNVPLRLALTAAGFRAGQYAGDAAAGTEPAKTGEPGGGAGPAETGEPGGGAGPADASEAGGASGAAARGGADGGAAVFRRGTGAPLPALPSWLLAPGEPGPATGTGGTGAAGQEPGGPDGAIAAELRQILARVTGRAELAGLPPGAALFGAGVALDSLTGTLLLREVQRRFGVDVAGTDLNLDALATLGTLAGFIAGQGGS
jgi:methoxymalonate biosynthesis protein